MQRILPIILIAGLCSACATTPSYENIPAENAVQLEVSADTLLNNFDFLGATDAYLKLVSNDLRQLRDVDDLTDKRMLRAHLEMVAMRLYSITQSIGNHVYISATFEELNICPDDGSIYEYASHLSDTPIARLGFLQHFEFVGPFDNERGIAFSSQLAAETNPGSDQTYSGKVRDVSWRTTPDKCDDSGTLNMGQLLNPNGQSALLMRTWVYANGSHNAHAVIGLEGELTAWCNAEVVLHAPGRHDMSTHNFSAPLALKPGWNELVFKLGSREHSPKISVRLVSDNAAHTPLLLEHRATAPFGVEAMTLALVGDAAAVAPQSLGALKFYTEINDHYHSGLMQMAYNSTPRSTHPGRDELAAAVAEQPDNLNRLFMYSYALFPKEYESAAEIDLNPWLQQSQRIDALAPEHIGNLANQLRASSKYQFLKQRSLDLAKRIVELADSAPPAVVALARTYEDLEQYDSARLCWKKVLDDPLSKNYPKSYYSALHLYNGNSPEFVDGMKGYYADHGSWGALRSLIDIHRRQREHFDVAAELEELETLAALTPWNTDLLCNAAMRMLNAGEIDVANQLLDRAEQIKPERATIWHHKARVALQAGNLEVAVASLERELEIDYSDETEQRLLEMINSAAQQESFEAPYLEDLAAIVARHPDDGSAAGYSLETLVRRAVIKVSPDSTAKRYYRDVVRLLNDEGVRRMARKGFGVRWGLQDLRVLSATILHIDGRTTNIPTGRGYSARVIEFPNLKVGDVIDVEYRIDDLRTSFFGTYFSLNHQLAPLPTVPTRESLLTLITDKQLPLKLHEKNLLGFIDKNTGVHQDGTTYDWAVSNIRPLKPESFMPHASELTAMIQASSYQSWSEFGDWWWNLIKDGITVSDEMADKVSELTDGLETKQHKLKAIYEFVTNEIRYNAWEFGVHGYQPYTAPVIFSRRFGDCKDKGILLRAMLSEADIEALPVLIMRSGTQALGARRPDQDLSLAMVEHFNHCIAYVPEQDGLAAQYMDGTANLTPLETLPFDDRGAQVVVIGPNGTERKLIPFKSAQFNVTEQLLSAQLDADGSATLDYVNNPYGSYDSRIRSTFAAGLEQNQETMRRIAASLFGAFDGELTIELPDVEALSTTPSFGFTGLFSKWSAVNNGVLELDASPFKDNMFNQYTNLADRETDVVMQHALTKRRQYNLVLPPGYVAEALQPIEMSNATGSYSWQMLIDGSTITIDEVVVVNSPRVAVADYSEFRELCRTIDDTQNLVIRIAEAN